MEAAATALDHSMEPNAKTASTDTGGKNALIPVLQHAWKKEFATLV